MTIDTTLNTHNFQLTNTFQAKKYLTAYQLSPFRREQKTPARKAFGMVQAWVAHFVTLITLP